MHHEAPRDKVDVFRIIQRGEKEGKIAFIYRKKEKEGNIGAEEKKKGGRTFRTGERRKEPCSARGKREKTLNLPKGESRERFRDRQPVLKKGRLGLKEVRAECVALGREGARRGRDVGRGGCGRGGMVMWLGGSG